jgi:hypothetical protein
MIRAPNIFAACAALAVVGTATLSGAAFAQQPAYVGTWASKPAQCKVGQNLEDAPIVMRRDGYDQYETHCRFSNIQSKGPSTWTVRATCSVQGDKQVDTLMLTVEKNRLTMRDKVGASSLTRCR